MPGYQPRHDKDPVWFNGQQVNTLNVSSTQTGVRITAVYGWDERPDVRDVRELRSGQDGEYADNLYLGGRTITLEGEVYGSTWVNLQSRKRALAALFTPSSSEALLKIPDPATASPTTSYSTTGMTGYERVSARVIEAIQFGDTLDPSCQVWQVVLRASDPRVYSDVETSTDSGTTGTATRTVTVDQSGTYATPTTLTATGPTGTSWQVSEPTSGLALASSSLTLVANESITFSTTDRTISFTSTYSGLRLRRTDVIAQWMLNETSGTTADNAQGTAAYDGTYTGGYALNQTGPATGIACVDFNGSTGYVTVPYNAALVPSELSLELWFRIDVASSATIFDAVDANRGWRLSTGTAGNLAIVGYDGASLAGFNTPAPLSATTWYHAVVTASTVTDQMQLYINGTLAGSVSIPGFLMPTAGALQIGRLDTASYFNGRVAAVTLYSGVLSGASVAELYAADEATSSVNGYSYLDAESAFWTHLGTASSTFSMSSDGLNTGSKLNVKYRDARI